MLILQLIHPVIESFRTQRESTVSVHSWASHTADILSCRAVGRLEIHSSERRKPSEVSLSRNNIVIHGRLSRSGPEAPRIILDLKLFQRIGPGKQRLHHVAKVSKMPAMSIEAGSVHVAYKARL